MIPQVDGHERQAVVVGQNHLEAVCERVLLKLDAGYLRGGWSRLYRSRPLCLRGAGTRHAVGSQGQREKGEEKPKDLIHSVVPPA